MMASMRHLPKRPLGQPDEAILFALYRYHYATAEQLLGLLYSDGSLTGLQTRLKKLVEQADVLQRVEAYPRAYRAGASPYVYCLARRGVNYLGEHGGEIGRFR